MSYRLTFALLALAVSVFAQGDTAWTIDTYAGSLPSAEGSALDAFLRSPEDIVVAPNGTVYIADANFNWVRSVSGNAISVIAGTGEPGFAGDGGPGRQARLNSPDSLALGSSGDLYIGESSNFRVPRVAADGTVTTVAGGGSISGEPPNGRAATDLRLPVQESIAYDASAEILYIGFRGWIWKVEDGSTTVIAGTDQEGYSGDGGPGAQAQVNRPADIAVGPDGSLYIADTRNYRIRRVDASGTISTIVGTGAPSSAIVPDGTPAAEADLTFVLALAFDSTGRLHFADGSDRVYRVNADDTVSLVVDFGPVLGTEGSTEAIAFDLDDNLYVADRIRTSIYRRPAAGGEIELIAGGSNLLGDGGPAIDARLNSPRDLTFDPAGRLVFVDSDNYAIRRISLNDQISRVAGNGSVITGRNNDGEIAAETNIGVIEDIAAALNGDVLFAQSRSIRSINAAGVLGSVPGLDPNGDIFVGAPTPAADGSIYLVSQLERIIYRLETNGTLTPVAGNGERGFSGDGGPALEASFSLIEDLAFDDFGNLFVADRGNDRIRKIDADSGVITTVAGNGGFTFRDGPALDTALGVRRIAFGPDKALYATSSYNRVLRIFQPATSAPSKEGATPEIGAGAMLATTAGSGLAGYSGDGGPALQAEVRAPEGIGLGPDGRMYLSDTGNHRIRVLEPRAATLDSRSLTNAASYAPGAAPGAILSLFGEGLSIETLISTTLPLPLNLGGTGVSIRDSAGALHFAPLFFVAPSQINFLLPDDVALGGATLTVRSADAAFEGPISISPAAPGLFSMNATGSGVGAITGIRVFDDFRTAVQVFRLDEAAGRFVTVPIQLGPEAGDVYLSLFGTGIRSAASLEGLEARVNGVAVPVVGFAPSAEFVGLDQINIGPLPVGLSSGIVGVWVRVDGQDSNRVEIELD